MGTTLIAGHTLDEYRAAALECARIEAEATHEAMRLEYERPMQKHAAILRIMEQPNPATGKAHSYSSAEALAETDAEYAAFLKEQREHARHAILARAKAWAARTRVAEGIALMGRVDA